MTRLPKPRAAVPTMAFLLLLVTFRAIVIPITAIVLNLLSVGAAYDVVVLVFQHTWAQGLLGFMSTGAITSWLPLFLFVIRVEPLGDHHPRGARPLPAPRTASSTGPLTHRRHRGPLEEP